MMIRAASKSETKRDPFADEIAMRLAMRQLACVRPVDSRAMSLPEIVRALERLAEQAWRISHG
jgi:hypothetical protein